MRNCWHERKKHSLQCRKTSHIGYINNVEIILENSTTPIYKTFIIVGLNKSSFLSVLLDFWLQTVGCVCGVSFKRISNFDLMDALSNWKKQFAAAEGEHACFTAYNKRYIKTTVLFFHNFLKQIIRWKGFLNKKSRTFIKVSHVYVWGLFVCKYALRKFCHANLLCLYWCWYRFLKLFGKTEKVKTNSFAQEKFFFSKG